MNNFLMVFQVLTKDQHKTLDRLIDLGGGIPSGSFDYIVVKQLYLWDKRLNTLFKFEPSDSLLFNRLFNSGLKES